MGELNNLEWISELEREERRGAEIKWDRDTKKDEVKDTEDPESSKEYLIGLSKDRSVEWGRRNSKR